VVRTKTSEFLQSLFILVSTEAAIINNASFIFIFLYFNKTQALHYARFNFNQEKDLVHMIRYVQGQARRLGKLNGRSTKLEIWIYIVFMLLGPLDHQSIILEIYKIMICVYAVVVDLEFNRGIEGGPHPMMMAMD